MLVILLLVFALVAPTWAKDVVATSKDRFRTVTVAPGDTLVVELDLSKESKSNLSAGKTYSYYVLKLDPKALSQQGEPTMKGTVQTFRFKVLKAPGKSSLSLGYSYPEGSSWHKPPVREFMVEVEVTP